MHFHVLGVGPIGVLISHHLRMALNPKHSVVLIHKEIAQKKRAQKLGNVLTVERGGAEHTVSGFQSEVFNLRRQLSQDQQRHLEPHDAEAESSSIPDASAPSTEEIESLFVTLKAPAVEAAIRQLQPRLRRDSTIVLMHNGMGMYERLVRDIFRNPEHRPHFILASNDHGAILKTYLHAIHTGMGSITFGIVPDPLGRDFEVGFSSPDAKPSLEDIMPPDEESERYSSLRNTVAVLSSMDGLNTSWKPISHVLTAMKRKLVVNAVINPLTALMGCRNGDIFPTQAALRISSRICSEAAKVFEADYHQGQSPDAPWEALRVGPNDMNDFPAALRREALEQEVQRVAYNTAGNISSMLGDVQKGKATEIDFMNGYLLQMGSTYKVQMPATAMLLNLIKMRTDIPINTSLLGISPGSDQKHERYVPVTQQVLDKALGRKHPWG
ncbi:hypothetical protein EVG20_g2458 [Dentipellis fragilis]|uniref:2-dehydropantoate 2-reductase n=1 Tax=Dentipellis fragilis TaxID=205917 RepID=A0A4Y9Z9R5_9AGAM|nr:hypothetical protein EVG20_g2458 [Dentipellis fragilis]